MFGLGRVGILKRLETAYYSSLKKVLGLCVTTNNMRLADKLRLREFSDHIARTWTKNSRKARGLTVEEDVDR